MDYKDARFKLLTLEKKQDEEGNEFAEFEGYGSVFSNEDLGGDVVEPGAFNKTIQENPEVPLLWQHWPDEVIGLNADLREDSKGLRIRGTINLAVERGREAYALLKQSALKGLSIGYDIVKVSRETNEETGDETRRLQEIKLWEISLVTFPMNQLARVEVVKSREKSHEVAEVLAEVKELRQVITVKGVGAGANSDALLWYKPISSGYLPEDAAEQVEAMKLWAESELRQTKEGRVISSSNRSKLAAVLDAMEAARTPIKELLDATEPGKATTPGEELKDDGDPDEFQSLVEELRAEAWMADMRSVNETVKGVS